MEQFTGRFWIIMFSLVVVICFYFTFFYNWSDRVEVQNECIIVVRDITGKPIETYYSNQVYQEDDYLLFKDKRSNYFLRMPYDGVTIICERKF